MATKSKLEQAVEETIETMSDAQKQIVMTQLCTYRQGLAQLARISEELKSVNAKQAVTFEQLRAKQAQRASLMYEQGQVASSNAAIAEGLFRFLKKE